VAEGQVEGGTNHHQQTTNRPHPQRKEARWPAASHAREVRVYFSSRVQQCIKHTSSEGRGSTKLLFRGHGARGLQAGSVRVESGKKDKGDEEKICKFSRMQTGRRKKKEHGTRATGKSLCTLLPLGGGVRQPRFLTNPRVAREGGRFNYKDGQDVAKPDIVTRPFFKQHPHRPGRKKRQSLLYKRKVQGNADL